MSKGIDYGLGQTNIDHETGIRFGVISSHEVLQAWCDESEAEYGPPSCPKCGNEAETFDSDKHGKYENDNGACCDYACETCKTILGSEDAFGDPLFHYLNDGEYRANDDDYGDIFIVKSPYYTRAAFCSPCVPGACSLSEPCEDGEKCYCFSHDFFEQGKAPYPVYRVDNNAEVLP